MWYQGNFCVYAKKREQRGIEHKGSAGRNVRWAHTQKKILFQIYLPLQAPEIQQRLSGESKA
ncbi:hypothetical protein OC25_07520 [Pedobacter kyungheensis]|uniref:Uncharacterized protein n=1 Tax=Pedobacter kyungheensis TaxID=1069985 RepID=A0A0C1DC65_9SPHI|nr:hypothetical protein OC25_07520 [Pedobacter kyungheensis]